MAKTPFPRRTRLLGACLVSFSLFAAATAAQGETADDSEPAAHVVAPDGAAAAPGSSNTVEAISKKEERRRLRELRKIANRWYGERRRFPARCHHCDGRGSILVLHAELGTTTTDTDGRKRARSRKSPWLAVRCPTCKGRGVFVSKASFMKVYYEMMSPAFRRKPGARELVEALHEQVQTGLREAGKFSFANQKRSVLVTPTHGIAWHQVQGERAWQPTFWVWSSEDGRRSTWFQYAEQADGAWPIGRADLPQPGAYPQLR